MMEEDDRFLYIVMELCENTIAKWLEEDEVANNEEWSKVTISLVLDIMRGIRYLHSHDILHRDLKVGFRLAF